MDTLEALKPDSPSKPASVYSGDGDDTEMDFENDSVRVRGVTPLGLSPAHCRLPDDCANVGRMFHVLCAQVFVRVRPPTKQETSHGERFPYTVGMPPAQRLKSESNRLYHCE